MTTENVTIAKFIRQNRAGLAKAMVNRHYELTPEVWKPYGHPGREKSERDSGYHLIYLAEALQAESPALFAEYLAWVKVLFAGLHFPANVLAISLNCMREELLANLPPELTANALEMLDAGIRSLADAPETLPSQLAGDAPLDVLARQFLQYLLNGERQPASRLILNAAQQGIPLKEIYLQVFQRTQREIGRLWQTNQVSVAQEHFCTAATQMIMSQLYPYIFTGEHKNRRMVVCCVGGELHEIGARMVADFFEMEGWDTYFLGANMPPASIIRMIGEQKADVLALSATMTFHISLVAEIIANLRSSPFASTRVLVGGYPFNLSAGLWQRVGADGYAPDASTALAEAERVLVL